MRIDSHVFYSEAHPPEHLSPVLTRNRFDGAILFARKRPPIDNILAIVVPVDLHDLSGADERSLSYAISQRRPSDLARRADHRIHWSAPPDLARQLDDCRLEPGFRGVAITLGDAIPQGLTELARRAIPLDIDVLPGALHLIPSVAAEVPRLVIDHLARPNFDAGLTDEWVAGMEAAARCPNVYCKISGLLTGHRSSAASIRPFVHHALSVFGTDRVMFGSEWPRSLPDATWKESLAVFTQCIGANTIETRESLLGNNAARFYAL